MNKHTTIGPVESINITEALIREKIPGLRDKLSDDQILDLTQVLRNNIGTKDGVLAIREILPAHVAEVLGRPWKDVFKSREEDKK